MPCPWRRRRRRDSRSPAIAPSQYLPGVVLRGGLVTRPDLVEAGERLVVERHLESGERVVELLDRPRPDDRSGDGVAGQQPGERDVRRIVAELPAEVFVRLDLLAMALEEVLGATLGTPDPLLLLAQHPAEKAAVQR